MPKDTTQVAASEEEDRAGLISNPLSDSRQRNRPFGRSIDDFRDQNTESGLLPAEEKLLVAVAKGEWSDFSNDKVRHKLREELDQAVSNAEIMKLAAETVASPRTVFQRHYDETKTERETCQRLEASIKERSDIVRQLLTEVPTFAEGIPKEPKDLKSRVIAEPNLLRTEYWTENSTVALAGFISIFAAAMVLPAIARRYWGWLN